jgi:hypothetical protein
MATFNIVKREPMLEKIITLLLSLALLVASTAFAAEGEAFPAYQLPNTTVHSLTMLSAKRVYQVLPGFGSYIGGSLHATKHTCVQARAINASTTCQSQNDPHHNGA